MLLSAVEMLTGVVVAVKAQAVAATLFADHDLRILHRESEEERRKMAITARKTG